MSCSDISNAWSTLLQEHLEDNSSAGMCWLGHPERMQPRLMWTLCHNGMSTWEQCAGRVFLPLNNLQVFWCSLSIYPHTCCFPLLQLDTVCTHGAVCTHDGRLKILLTEMPHHVAEAWERQPTQELNPGCSPCCHEVTLGSSGGYGTMCS